MYETLGHSPTTAFGWISTIFITNIHVPTGIIRLFIHRGITSFLLNLSLESFSFASRQRENPPSEGIWALADPRTNETILSALKPRGKTNSAARFSPVDFIASGTVFFMHFPWASIEGLSTLTDSDSVWGAATTCSRSARRRSPKKPDSIFTIGPTCWVRSISPPWPIENPQQHKMHKAFCRATPNGLNPCLLLFLHCLQQLHSCFLFIHIYAQQSDQTTAGNWFSGNGAFTLQMQLMRHMRGFEWHLRAAAVGLSDKTPNTAA